MAYAIFFVAIMLPYVLVFVLPVVYLEYAERRRAAFIYALFAALICVLDINFNFDGISYPHFMLGFYSEWPALTYFVVGPMVLYSFYKFLSRSEY